MVTDSESGLGLHDKGLVSKILLFELYAQISKNNKTWCTHILSAPPIFDLKIVYFSVFEVGDSESGLGLHDKALVSKILLFELYA